MFPVSMFLAALMLAFGAIHLSFTKGEVIALLVCSLFAVGVGLLELWREDRS